MFYRVLLCSTALQLYITMSIVSKNKGYATSPTCLQIAILFHSVLSCSTLLHSDSSWFDPTTFLKIKRCDHLYTLLFPTPSRLSCVNVTHDANFGDSQHERIVRVHLMHHACPPLTASSHLCSQTHTTPAFARTSTRVHPRQCLFVCMH
jgi:hypothetical protein